MAKEYARSSHIYKTSCMDVKSKVLWNLRDCTLYFETVTSDFGTKRPEFSVKPNLKNRKQL